MFKTGNKYAYKNFSKKVSQRVLLIISMHFVYPGVLCAFVVQKLAGIFFGFFTMLYNVAFFKQYIL